MDIEKIKDKVAKLLALANHKATPEHEAASAARFAEELLKEYNINLDTTDKVVIKQVQLPLKGKTASILEKKIASVLRKYAGIRVFITIKGGLDLLGTEQGVSYFSEAFAEAIYRADRGIQLMYKTLKEGTPTTVKFDMRNSYIEGFVAGLSEYMASTCTSLILVTPAKDIAEFLKEKGLRVGAKAVTTSKTKHNSDAFERGRQDGNSAMRIKVIDEH